MRIGIGIRMRIGIGIGIRIRMRIGISPIENATGFAIFHYQFGTHMKYNRNHHCVQIMSASSFQGLVIGQVGFRVGVRKNAGRPI
jgi:hypothetical protein